jgi:hypothetical protein
VSRSTGLVSNTTAETNALNAFKTRLDTLKSQLIAAGDTNYFVCAQACGQDPSTSGGYAMPPSGGITKIWQKVQASGWDTYGIGWFLFDSYDPATLPGENLNGFGETGYSAQLSEVTTVNTSKTEVLYPPANLTVSPPFSMLGSTVTATGCPIGQRTSGTCSLTSSGGVVRVSSSRYSVSLDGVSWSGSVTIPSGTQTFHLGVTPQAGDGVITTRLEVAL